MNDDLQAAWDRFCNDLLETWLGRQLTKFVDWLNRKLGGDT